MNVRMVARGVVEEYRSVAAMGASRKAIVACVAGGVPVLLEDVPGTGKSAFASGLARSFGLEFVRVDLNACTPELIAGVPFVDSGSSTTKLAKSDVVAAIEATAAMNKWTLVLLDELASPLFFEARSVWLQMLADPLSARIAFVATCNPVQQAEAGRELSGAIRARFVRLPFTQSAAEFIRGITGEYTSTDKRWSILVGSSEFDDTSRDVAVVLAAYLDKVGAWGEFSAMAMCTPRVVHMAARALAAAMMLFPTDWEDAARLILRGSIGEPGEGFIPWLKEQFAIRPEALLDPEARKSLKEEELVALAHKFVSWAAGEDAKKILTAAVVWECLADLEVRSKEAATLVAAAIAKHCSNLIGEVIERYGTPATIRRLAKAQCG